MKPSLDSQGLRASDESLDVECLLFSVIGNLENIERGQRREKKNPKHLTTGPETLSFLCARPRGIAVQGRVFTAVTPQATEARDLCPCSAGLLQAWCHMGLKVIRTRGVSSP